MAGIAALCGAYVLSQFYRSFLAVLTPVLTDEMGMDPSELSIASGVWFITFALSQFPVGYALDTWGPRRTAGSMILLFAGSGILLFGFAGNAYHIILAMGLIGIGCASALMAPFYIFARTLSGARFATYASVFVAIGMVGNVFSTQPLAWAMQVFGWQGVSLLLCAVTLCVGMAILVLTVDPVKPQSDTNTGGFREVLKIRELWPIFPMILAGSSVSIGLRSLWAGPFFSGIYGFDQLAIGEAVFFLATALIAGTLFFGPLDRIFNTRKWVVVGANIAVLAACLLLAGGAPDSSLTGIILLGAIIGFGASYAVQMTHGKAFVPAHLTGRGITLLNFCTMSGAGIAQTASGWVVEANTISGNPEAAYQALFMFYAIITAAALSLYVFSRDAKP